MSRVVLLLLLSGCDLLFQLRHVPSRDAAGEVGPWRTPTIINAVNVLGNGAWETDPSMTRDELEIFFSSERAGGEGGFDIYHATRENASEDFMAPIRVSELSTAQNDWGFLTADGKNFYFSHGGASGIEVAGRPDSASTFGAPSPELQFSALPMVGNVELSGNGLTAIANAMTTDADQDLHLFTRPDLMSGWSTPVRQTLVNSAVLDGGGTLDEEGLTLVFHSERNGARDIWIATRPDVTMPFDMPVPVTELGTGSDPWLAPNARTLVFQRDGDLYISTR